MAYVVQYASTAEAELTKLSAARQCEVRSGIDGFIGRDPYGCGSAPVRGNRDRFLRRREPGRSFHAEIV
ncbi:hypothetical protein ACFRCG_29440 [Embleya sp. NPDC056575]|uniref:hypothetical protein n=1 Tax=unclassified Embleya TaxID=2699296 RepID=UPI0036AF6A91